MRHKKVEKRITEADTIHNNRLVAKLINKVMKDGKKTVAQNVVYKAFAIIKEKGNGPISVFEKALQNVGPKQEVRPRRIGGASYQIPAEVRSDRRVSLALRWIIDAARARSNKEFHTFEQKLATELLDASQNQGAAIKKRDTVQRMADANKAFAHFRW